jgi:hypothetical protein
MTKAALENVLPRFFSLLQPSGTFLRNLMHYYTPREYFAVRIFILATREDVLPTEFHSRSLRERIAGRILLLAARENVLPGVFRSRNLMYCYCPWQ